jgi:hypothetical protein
MVTVGCGAGAGGAAGGIAATCFLHPAANPRTNMNPESSTALRRLRTFINTSFGVSARALRTNTEQWIWACVYLFDFIFTNSSEKQLDEDE